MYNITQISEYNKEEFSFKMRNDIVANHDVYSIGDGDKVVVIIQELPGIGQETLALADKFVAKGYRVVMPHLFGPLGKTATGGNLFRVMCMRKEFKLFAKNETSPIVDFLSGLCSSLKERHKVKGVAVIGMCLTGNFAISLMANDDVLAGFASQPSMAIMKQDSLHMSENDITRITKIDLLKSTFNHDDQERIIFHTLPGDGHSILTLDFVDKKGHPTHQTLETVFGYFDEQLG